MKRAIIITTKIMVVFSMLAMTLSGAFALAADFTSLGSCYGDSTSTQLGGGNNRSQFTVIETCESTGNSIDYTENLQLSLGPLQVGDVIIQDNAIFVDSALRPDLDATAVLTFYNQQFATEPDVLVDGSACGTCTGITYEDQTLMVNVTGFSNYSLQGKKEFSLYSDEQPELQGKVYQTIDLGAANRNANYTCVVMIFADDRNGNLALVQTNPERAVQGRLFGDTDGNQPESLGYFPTQNGVANVYFRNDKLVGYTDFQYVAQCQSSDGSELVYEETINAVQAPLGRGFTSWAVWLTTDNDGENGFFLVFYIIGGVVMIWLLALFVRSLR